MTLLLIFLVENLIKTLDQYPVGSSFLIALVILTKDRGLASTLPGRKFRRSAGRNPRKGRSGR
jgi:hypothetical protein